MKHQVVTARKKRGSKQVAPTVVVVGQSSKPTRMRLLVEEEEEEEEGGVAAEQISIALSHVAQLVVCQNPGTFMGVPEDPELEDSALSKF